MLYAGRVQKTQRAQGERALIFGIEGPTSVPCPRCRAVIGDPCVWPVGAYASQPRLHAVRRRTHAAVVDAMARRARDERLGKSLDEKLKSTLDHAFSVPPIDLGDFTRFLREEES